MKIRTVVIIISLFLLTATTMAQYKAGHKLSGIGLPFFRTGIFRTFTEDGSTRIVRLYLQLLNDDLTFVKEGDVFQARLQYEVYVYNSAKEAVFNDSERKEIETTRFEETNSRNIKNTFTVDLDLPPGTYDAVITVLDRNSNKQVNRKIEIRVKDLEEQKFLISDLLYFTQYTTDKSGRVTSFEPSLTGNFAGSTEHIYFYFTSIVEDTLDTLNIQYSIRDASGSLNQFNQYSLVGKPKFQEHYIRLNRQMFDQNRYELIVTGRYKGKTMEARKLFSFFWTIAPESPKDLNTALEQMKYIIEADSIDWALKQTYEVKKKFFRKFWKRQDPNPSTVKNELLDEFFRRVNFATETFSTMTIDGWRTDRGRIFIKFGEPDDIERHPFEINTYPFEVWRYYNLQKTFVFIDRSGFGDYYLHPNYLDEEYN